MKEVIEKAFNWLIGLLGAISIILFNEVTGEIERSSERIKSIDLSVAVVSAEIKHLNDRLTIIDTAFHEHERAINQYKLRNGAHGTRQYRSIK